MLEWSQETNRTAVWSGVITSAVVALLPTVEGDGFWWVSKWWWWLIILLPGVLIFFIMQGSWLAAGTSWLQNKDKWVDTYELTGIDVQANGVNQMLRLTDTSGRSLGSLKLRDVQRNQALWDLAYNGILHSVITGKADPPTNVRTVLKLPGGKGQHRDGS